MLTIKMETFKNIITANQPFYLAKSCLLSCKLVYNSKYIPLNGDLIPSNY